VLATKGAIEKLPGQPNGFYAVSACSIGLGVLWLHCMHGRARALQAHYSSPSPSPSPSASPSANANPNPQP